MSSSAAKLIGQFYSPERVASSLMQWLRLGERERFLDPSCGDGRFIEHHNNSVGIDISAASCDAAHARAPRATILETDFFAWALQTAERFDCVGGNPPFIRYQNFNGNFRRNALNLSTVLGAKFSALTSSWAPFVIVSASLLKPGGRMAFIVPAEIGHATYSIPLLKSLVDHFSRVVVVAIKDKMFPGLSEDTWLLYAEGRGGQAKSVELAAWNKFVSTSAPPTDTKKVTAKALERHGMRLRKFLLPDPILEYYLSASERTDVVTLGSVARVGIGYVTGANDFFHLKPSEAKRLGIPESFLKVAVRKGEQLPSEDVDESLVRAWIERDEPVLLLDLSNTERLPKSIRQYLESDAARQASKTYKCRNRNPWYVVPDISKPDAFLTYMSGKRPSLVANSAGCVCSNSVHAVRLREGVSIDDLLQAWNHPLTDLSKEIEGHPLGGGLLKLEPGEANRVLLALNGETRKTFDITLLEHGIRIAREWRHCAEVFTNLPEN